MAEHSGRGVKDALGVRIVEMSCCWQCGVVLELYLEGGTHEIWWWWWRDNMALVGVPGL